jgi:hypothetical protein
MPHYDLRPGHVLFIQKAGALFRISKVTPFNFPLSVTLTAGQTLTNQEITELRSPEDQIYHVSGISMEDDVNFTYKHRGESQVGVKRTENLTIDDAPEDIPYEADWWIWNISPFYDITENRSLAKTAIIHFYGERYELEKLSGKPKDFKGPFTIVDG